MLNSSVSLYTVLILCTYWYLLCTYTVLTTKPNTNINGDDSGK